MDRTESTELMNTATTRGASTRERRVRPIPVGSSARARGGPRYHAMDALRGASMFLVVSLHAALAYTQLDVPRLLWGTREPSTSSAVDLFCWWAMGVSLPLFFTIGGFFAAEIYRSRGPRGFLRDRGERIAAPLLAAVVSILPLTFLAWSFGWLVSGRCTLREVRRLKFHAPGFQDELFGPAHLWFLEYLIVMLLIFSAVRWRRPAAEPAPLGGWLDRLLLSGWRPLVLMVPTALVLWLSRGHVGLDAVLDRHNSFFPDPLRLLHHGLFFAVGVRLHRLRLGLDRFRSFSLFYLALAVPVFLGRAWLLREDWARPLDGAGVVAMVTLAALFGWLTVFGFLGLALRTCDRPNRVVRYLADSSYWIYLIHFPLVGLIQADLYQVRLPAPAKFVAVLGLTLALGLASYQVLVRYTAIGRCLHGAREAR